MKMWNIIRKRAGIIALAALTPGLSGCDSFIFDDEGDCSVRYRVGFRYSRNILNADAFGPQVTDVRLYLFDGEGTPVFSRHERRAVTADNDFYMEVDVPPGTYDILAWCGGDSPVADAVSFAISGGDAPASISDLSATLPLEGESPALYSGHDITPLYHGMATGVEFPDTYGTVDLAPVTLTKDTNHITLQLLNTDGSRIDPSIISVSLEADNSHLDWLNMPVGGERFVYRPWSLRGLTADVETGRARADAETTPAHEATGVQAEITTGRLMADVEQTLTIRRTDTDEIIIRIPLIEYLLLVRSEYEVAMSDQDYLDRYDGYSMVFFMQDGYTWIKSRILINGWRVVPPQTGNV